MADQSEKGKGGGVAVIGAAIYDLIAYIPRLPVEGETIKGSDFRTGFGGKGANQAVMAAILGSKVFMVTKLGKDQFGDLTFQNLKDRGICTQHVHRTSEAPTGVAPIAVDAKGNNSIIIVGGANNLLSSEEVEKSRETISQASVMLCQLELPMEITAKALQVAKEENLRTILNTAPAPAHASDIPKDLYQWVDIWCANEPELHQLTDLPVDTEEEIATAAKVLISRGASVVLITLGARGALLVEANTLGNSEIQCKRFEAPKAKTKDTSGAGDCFLGAFAYFMDQGYPMAECVQLSNKVAAISVERLGTQSSYPTREELVSLGIVPS